MAGLALSACAAGGPLAPLPGAPGSDLTMQDATGAPIAVSIWEPEDRPPEAVVLALHGFGDYGSSTYGRAAVDWATKGIATIAPDQRGFGRNPSRGRWPGAEALAADAVALTEQVRDRYPCLPVTLIGHSMGGGVALGAAGTAQPDALILAAPAIWGGKNLNPFHRLVAWMAASVVPDQRFSGRGVVRIQASDNIEVLRALARDPLYLSPPSARELFGLVRVTDQAHRNAGQAAMPALLLLGEKDQILPARAVRTVFDTLPGEKTVIEYPDGWHLLFRDLQAERVWADVAGWVPRAADPACEASQ